MKIYDKCKKIIQQYVCGENMKNNSKKCQGLDKNFKCKHGFYKTTLFCHGKNDNMIPECLKDDCIPTFHDGHGKPLINNQKGYYKHSHWKYL